MTHTIELKLITLPHPTSLGLGLNLEAMSPTAKPTRIKKYIHCYTLSQSYHLQIVHWGGNAKKTWFSIFWEGLGGIKIG